MRRLGSPGVDHTAFAGSLTLRERCNPSPKRASTTHEYGLVVDDHDYGTPREMPHRRRRTGSTRTCGSSARFGGASRAESRHAYCTHSSTSARYLRLPST